LDSDSKVQFHGNPVSIFVKTTFGIEASQQFQVVQSVEELN
jgi:hypothetical protein